MGNIPEMYARHKAEKEKEKMMENAEGINPFREDENDDSEEKKQKKDRFGRWRKPANEDQLEGVEKQKGGCFGFFDSKKEKQDSRSSSSQREKIEKKKPSFLGSKLKKDKVTNPEYAIKVNDHKVLSMNAERTLEKLDRDVPSVKGKDIYLIKEQKATYQGQFSNKVPHGKGITHFGDGSFYGGQFKEGDAHGNGIFIFKDGSYYRGDFYESKFNGKGEIHYKDEELIYKGEWRDGVPCGHGVEESIRDRYEGQFDRSGRKSGYGEYRWANGKMYKGEFQDGAMHGEGSLYGENGQAIYVGHYKNGKKDGKGVFKTNLGSYQGNFTNDHLNGEGTFVWNDGKVYQGDFQQTKMEGSGKIYYPSGQIAEGVWAEGHNISLNKVDNDRSEAKDKIQDIKKKHRMPEPQNHRNNSYQSYDRQANQSRSSSEKDRRMEYA